MKSNFKILIHVSMILINLFLVLNFAYELDAFVFTGLCLNVMIFLVKLDSLIENNTEVNNGDNS